jgi:tetratricopeptide (TPR) repeat protein
MEWWEEMGYHPFAAGNDGFPQTGQVIKYYREQKRYPSGEIMYTQKDLAGALGLSRSETVAEMETQNTRIDMPRRQALCDLLDIPPRLFGIVTLAEMIGLATITTQGKMLDIEEYRQYLIAAWKANHATSAQSTLGDMLSRISILYGALPYANHPTKPQIHELLCDYHLFVANLLRDQQHYPDAVQHLNKAYLTADALGSDEKRARVHQHRSGFFGDAQDYDKALLDSEKANLYMTKLPLHLRGPIILGLGLGRARIATTQAERLEAIRLFDQGARIIERSQDAENHYQSDRSPDRTHLTRSVALMAVGWYKEADREIAQAHCGPEQKRRQAYQDILQAQVHVNLGRFPAALALLTSALQTMRAIGSQINIMRIADLYKQVKSKYDGNDMHDLSVLLSSK